jgi:hypothetical protein
MAIARACSDAGDAAVSYAGVWNSTGDPDPYNSYPFSSLTLIAPEARLTYRRPGADPAGYPVFSSIDAEIVIVDLPGHDFPWLAFDAASTGPGCLATWGFDSEGFPRLDGLAAPVMAHLLSRLVPGGCCAAGCGGGCAEGTKLWVGEKRIPLSGYPRRVLEEVVTAIVGTLHGVDGDGAVRIEITRGR